MTTAQTRTGSGKLAINRLKSAKPLDGDAVDRFLVDAHERAWAGEL